MSGAPLRSANVLLGLLVATAASCAGGDAVEQAHGRLVDSRLSSESTIWDLYRMDQQTGWVLVERSAEGAETGRVAQATAVGEDHVAIAVQTPGQVVTAEFDAAGNVVGDSPAPADSSELDALASVLNQTFDDGIAPTASGILQWIAAGIAVAVAIGTYVWKIAHSNGCASIRACGDGPVGRPCVGTELECRRQRCVYGAPASQRPLLSCVEGCRSDDSCKHGCLRRYPVETSVLRTCMDGCAEEARQCIDADCTPGATPEATAAFRAFAECRGASYRACVDRTDGRQEYEACITAVCASTPCT